MNALHVELNRLLGIMDDLRLKCPWDQKQTMETLRHLTIEETYELSDAILKGDKNEIKKAIDSPELKKRLEDFEPWTMSPAEMNARIKSDYEKYGRLMKLVGSKLD